KTQLAHAISSLFLFMVPAIGDCTSTLRSCENVIFAALWLKNQSGKRYFQANSIPQIAMF
ncbi:hypothetical protein, partial [Escherichia coli]|uniref:hypothetical protein n=1 Tax=Escherichia coli TaxID=562 RepID=UPI001BFC025A